MKTTRQRSTRVLAGLAIIASVMGMTTSCDNSATTAGKLPAASRSSQASGPARTPAAGRSAGARSGPAPLSAEARALLADGAGPGSKGYFQGASSSLVAAAAGHDNAGFSRLGKLLVADGLSHAIIDLGREMNASWYEWSEQRAPSSEPDAYILAWRHAVQAMRSVPGQHFKFLWTLYMDDTSPRESWPGSAYVDYVGTDIFDWYGGPGYTYPHTASGALDHQKKWQEILTTPVGGLNWIAQFSRATGKPIIIPEWGLDFHTFGGQDDLLFIRNMMTWLKQHHAIGLYWGAQHLRSVASAHGRLLARQGESAQNNTVGEVNALGALLGGRLQYAGVYLPDRARLSDRTDQPVLAPWAKAGYRIILSVPIVPLPPAIKSYSGPPEPGDRPYQLADYPDAIAAIKRGL
jgi:hypothetical protein